MKQDRSNNSIVMKNILIVTKIFQEVIVTKHPHLVTTQKNKQKLLQKCYRVLEREVSSRYK